MMLDVCTALCRLKPIEQTFDLAAGDGVQLWSIFLDLHQLRAAQGRGGELRLARTGSHADLFEELPLAHL